VPIASSPIIKDRVVSSGTAVGRGVGDNSGVGGTGVGVGGTGVNVGVGGTGQVDGTVADLALSPALFAAVTVKVLVVKSVVV
jgi:hypothetical protein